MTATPRTTLLDTFPLPEGWSPLQIVEDTVVVDGIELWRAGIASVGPEGEEVTGAGAETGAVTDRLITPPLSDRPRQ